MTTPQVIDLAEPRRLTAHNLTLDRRVTELADEYVHKPGSKWRSKSELTNSLLVKFLRSKGVEVPNDYISK